MKFYHRLKREFYCTDFKIAFVMIGIHFILGILSVLLGGGNHLYHCLSLPHFAPSQTVFVLAWSCIYVLLGFSLGVYRSPCVGFSHIPKTFSLFCYVSFCLTLFLWYPFFFGAHMFWVAFILSAIILFLSCFILRQYRKTSLLAAFLFLPCCIWFAFSFFLNFCILVLN